MSSATMTECWAEKVTTLGELLSAASAANEWQTVDALVQHYATLLRLPPMANAARIAPVYRTAQQVLAQVAAGAVEQRDKIGHDVRTVGRGRKALSAYR